jgi:hypothetical protein
VQQTVSNSFTLTKALAEVFHAGAVADEIALIAVQRMLAHRLIVIDDLERKSKDLEIDEVFGFIDSACPENGSRFLSILNIEHTGCARLRAHDTCCGRNESYEGQSRGRTVRDRGATLRARTVCKDRQVDGASPSLWPGSAAGSSADPTADCGIGPRHAARAALAAV